MNFVLSEEERNEMRSAEQIHQCRIWESSPEQWIIFSGYNRIICQLKQMAHWKRHYPNAVCYESKRLCTQMAPQSTKRSSLRIKRLSETKRGKGLACTQLTLTRFSNACQNGNRRRKKNKTRCEILLLQSHGSCLNMADIFCPAHSCLVPNKSMHFLSLETALAVKLWVSASWLKHNVL